MGKMGSKKEGLPRETKPSNYLSDLACKDKCFSQIFVVSPKQQRDILRGVAKMEEFGIINDVYSVTRQVSKNKNILILTYRT
jgi:hypothetical protein